MVPTYLQLRQAHAFSKLPRLTFAAHHVRTIRVWCTDGTSNFRVFAETLQAWGGELFPMSLVRGSVGWRVFSAANALSARVRLTDRMGCPILSVRPVDLASHCAWGLEYSIGRPVWLSIYSVRCTAMSCAKFSLMGTEKPLNPPLVEKSVHRLQLQFLRDSPYREVSQLHCWWTHCVWVTCCVMWCRFSREDWAFTGLKRKAVKRCHYTRSNFIAP